MSIEKPTLPNELTPSTRQSVILEALNEDERVRVVDLSDQLNTSVVTIRKDLDELEKEGLLERVHGGAIKNFRVQQNIAFSERMNTKKAEKKKIAVATAKLIGDGESVIINSGSTSYYVAQHLRDKKHMIVITNALQIFNEIAYYKNITSFFLGGKFNNEMEITYGEDTLEQLNKYWADKLIIGMDGIDLVAGATTNNHAEDTVFARMMERSKEKILIVDDSKIGNVAFAHIAPLSAYDTIVTNHTPGNEQFYREAERLGLRVIAV